MITQQLQLYVNSIFLTRIWENGPKLPAYV